MKMKIYYIPGSHPCEAVFKAAELKGIDYKRVVVIPPAHRLQMTLMQGDRTVPAIKITGGPNGTEKIQTSRKIIRAFESMVPEPALFPSNASQRERVVAAETWGDGDFQDLGRRLIWAYLAREPKAMEDFSRGHKLPVPGLIANASAGLMTKIQAKLNHSSDENVREDLEQLPELLRQVDQYIADGVIGGDQVNAADLQIFSSLWLWRSMEDVRVAVDARPCGPITQRLFGDPPGHLRSGILPAAWFTALNASTADLSEAAV